MTSGRDENGAVSFGASPRGVYPSHDHPVPIDLVDVLEFAVCLALALRSGFSRIPVVGENVDDIVGVAYLKDLVRRAQDVEAARATRIEDIMREPAAALEDIGTFLGVARHDGPARFIEERRAETRGGRYSSFRSPDDVERAWERHLSIGQRRVIANVVAYMDMTP